MSNATICARCGHSSDEHAFRDGYVEADPTSHDVDFGPTHCHALGGCDVPVCPCRDFESGPEETQQ